MDNVRLQSVIKIGSSLGVVLPKPVCKALGIERGDRITFAVFEHNTVVVRKLSAAELKALQPRQINFN